MKKTETAEIEAASYNLGSVEEFDERMRQLSQFSQIKAKSASKKGSAPMPAKFGDSQQVTETNNDENELANNNVTRRSLENQDFEAKEVA